MLRFFVCLFVVAWSLTVAGAARADGFQDALKAFNEKNFPRAVEILDALIQEKPKALKSYALRGRALVEIGQFERAIEDLSKVIGEKDDAGPALYYRGRAYLSLQPPKIDEALADLNKAIDIDHKVADWHYERGRAHALRDDLDAAFSEVHEAIALDPERPVFYVVRGRIQVGRACEREHVTYESGGKTYSAIRLKLVKDPELLQQGIADFGRALEKDPNNLEALHARLDAYRLSNQTQESVDDARAICKLLPNDAGWQNYLGWILATHPDDTIRNGKEAIELAEKACTLTEYKDLRYIDTLAAAYAEAKRFKKAIEAQEKAIALLDPNTPEETKKYFEDRLELYKNKKPFREGAAPKAAE